MFRHRRQAHAVTAIWPGRDCEPGSKGPKASNCDPPQQNSRTLKIGRTCSPGSARSAAGKSRRLTASVRTAPRHNQRRRCRLRRLRRWCRNIRSLSPRLSRRLRRRPRHHHFRPRSLLMHLLRPRSLPTPRRRRPGRRRPRRRRHMRLLHRSPRKRITPSLPRRRRSRPRRCSALRRPPSLCPPHEWGYPPG